jgi:hypothetical protein
LADQHNMLTTEKFEIRLNLSFNLTDPFN